MTTPSSLPPVAFHPQHAGVASSRGDRNRRPKERVLSGFTVNLLPKATDANRRRRSLIRAVQAALLLLLVVVVGAIAMMWSMTALSTRKLVQEEQRIGALQNRIGARSSVEQRYHLVLNRATLAQKIFSEQQRFDRILEQLFGVLPEGVDFVSASLTDSADTIEVSVETSSLSALQELLSALRADPLSRTVITKQHRSADGTYELNFNLTFS